MSIPKEFKLNNGTSIPSIGFGTWMLHDKAAIVRAVMEAGYIHIDTAMIYENEHLVGEALAECFAQGKKREDLFVTTKLWHSQYADVEGAM